MSMSSHLQGHLFNFMASKKPPRFDTTEFLKSIGAGRRVIEIKAKETIYSQGQACDAVFYVQSGKVRLNVVSRRGKEATVAIISAKEFFGESSIAGHILRLESATAMTDAQLLRIDKRAMLKVLHQSEFAFLFVTHLLTRNARFQEDLIDQLFNSSEKRLARVLLLLAHYGNEGKPDPVIPKISQEVLAEMVGTTRSRVSFFMNRFRRMGFIEYTDRISVHRSLLTVVLHD